ncbi:hypothetical protein Ancab_035716 [Ancistrocladus abbreviatus]
MDRGGSARPIPVGAPLTLSMEEESSSRTLRLDLNKEPLLDPTHRDSGPLGLSCPKPLDQGLPLNMVHLEAQSSLLGRRPMLKVGLSHMLPNFA